MYSALPIIVKGNSPLGLYCEENARRAKNLYNAALFRIRQIFTAYGKDSLTENEKEVMEELRLMTEAGYPPVQKVIGYYALERLLRITKNPDFFSGLPKQTAQAVVRQAVTDFSSWLAALRDYQEHPKKIHRKAEDAALPEGGASYLHCYQSGCGPPERFPEASEDKTQAPGIKPQREGCQP